MNWPTLLKQHLENHALAQQREHGHAWPGSRPASSRPRSKDCCLSALFSFFRWSPAHQRACSHFWRQVKELGGGERERFIQEGNREIEVEGGREGECFMLDREKDRGRESERASERARTLAPSRTALAYHTAFVGSLEKDLIYGGRGGRIVMQPTSNPTESVALTSTCGLIQSRTQLSHRPC